MKSTFDVQTFSRGRRRGSRRSGVTRGSPSYASGVEICNSLTFNRGSLRQILNLSNQWVLVGIKTLRNRQTVTN